jgi:hypothetical protein
LANSPTSFGPFPFANHVESTTALLLTLKLTKYKNPNLGVRAYESDRYNLFACLKSLRFVPVFPVRKFKNERLMELFSQKKAWILFQALWRNKILTCR